MKDFKKFFPYAVALALTYLGFLCMSIPYFNSKISVDFLEISGVFSSYPANGYSALSLWNYGWSGVLVSIFQLFELILMAGILIFAVVGIFSEILAKASGREAHRYFQKTMFLMMLVNLCLDFVILIFVIVMTAVHKYSLNAGLFLKLFFDGAAFAGLLLGRHFFNEKPLIKSLPLSDASSAKNRDEY